MISSFILIVGNTDTGQVVTTDIGSNNIKDSSFNVFLLMYVCTHYHGYHGNKVNYVSKVIKFHT